MKNTMETDDILMPHSEEINAKCRQWLIDYLGQEGVDIPRKYPMDWYSDPVPMAEFLADLPADCGNNLHDILQFTCAGGRSDFECFDEFVTETICEYLAGHGWDDSCELWREQIIDDLIYEVDQEYLQNMIVKTSEVFEPFTFLQG